MSVIRCKRCNKVLTNPASIKRGMGIRCYLNYSKDHTKPLDSFGLNDQISLIKNDIEKIKEELLLISNGNFVPKITDIDIKKLRKPPTIDGLERPIKGMKGDLIKEMKELFAKVDGIRDLLTTYIPEEKIL